MRKIVALLSGILFGTGLVVSDMINAVRVQAFLDPFGNWDPTLAFVMGGAMIPMIIAWRLSQTRTPAFAPAFPGKSDTIDTRLIGGSVLFGAGWGLVGLCPGPAIAAISFGGFPLALFVTAMLIGMGLFSVLGQPRVQQT